MHLFPSTPLDFARVIRMLPSVSVSGWIFINLFALVSILLLVNLLIAMFGETFSRINEHSTEEYLFWRTSVVLESRDIPALPPPLNGLVLLSWVAKSVLAMERAVVWTLRQLWDSLASLFRAKPPVEGSSSPADGKTDADIEEGVNPGAVDASRRGNAPAAEEEKERKSDDGESSETTTPSDFGVDEGDLDTTTAEKRAQEVRSGALLRFGLPHTKLPPSATAFVHLPLTTRP